MASLHHLLLAAALAGIPAAAGAAPAPAPATQAQADWRREFEAVCARTQDAMALPLEELRSLVERCDKLGGALETLGDSERKVAARRLRACRELYAYVLAARQAAP